MAVSLDMHWFLANMPNVAAYVSADGLATLRNLYGLDGQDDAATREEKEAA